MKQKQPNGWALLPILVFLVLYLGNGIYFEYIHPVKGQMGFYVISIVVTFVMRRRRRRDGVFLAGTGGDGCIFPTSHIGPTLQEYTSHLSF